MKHLNRIIVAGTIISALVSCSQQTSPEHSPEAVALLERIEAVAASDSHMVGHQDDLVYGKHWNINIDGVQDFSRSDVQSCTGDFPAVVGFELGEIELGGEYSLDSVRFDHIRQASLAHYGRGGVVTYSWHCRNPLTGGSSWDVSSDKVVKSVLPGGSEHDKFMGWLDILANYFLSIRTDDGTLMPFIFRPWHEHSGNWFWWGVDGKCTPDEYVALWRMTYDYLVGERGLDNMIWVLSPDARTGLERDFVERTYPGDGYVDLLGLDCYWWAGEDLKAQTRNYVERMRSSLAVLSELGEKHHKAITVSETGSEGLPDRNWWTEGLAASIEGFRIAYVMTWRNASDEAHRDHYYCIYPGEPSEPDFKLYVSRTGALLLNDIR